MWPSQKSSVENETKASEDMGFLRKSYWSMYPEQWVRNRRYAMLKHEYQLLKEEVDIIRHIQNIIIDFTREKSKQGKHYIYHFSGS